MALAGHGVLALWFDIAPEALDDFFEWHNREHMPERLSNPGFRCGRRFGALDASRQFLVLYETNGSENPAGAEYLNRVRYRTPWSQRTSLLRSTRAIYRVLLSLGRGQGATIASLRFGVADGREEAVRRRLAHEILPRLVDEPGIAGCHLCRVDRHSMGIAASEKIELKSLSLGSDRRDWVVFVEGSRNAATLRDACASALPDASLVDAGVDTDVERGLFQLEYALFRAL